MQNKHNLKMSYRLYAEYIITATVFLPLITAFLNYKRLTWPLKIILYFLLFSGILNLIAIILAHHHRHTLSLLHIFTIFEFAFISLFYLNLFKKSWRKPILILIGAFSLLCIVNLIFIQTGLQFNTYTLSLEAVIIIGYCVQFLNQQSSIDTEHSWGSNSLNWINAGILIYYASGLFMFIASNYFLQHKELAVFIYPILDTFLLFEYILFAIGFYKCKQ